jgi:signal transduction histidine kinase
MESMHADNTDFSEFVRSFGEATARLQETHAALKKQVERLQNELAEANERLRRSRSLAALGEMAAGIAHEIRNPLGAIALNAEMLQDDVADRPESAASVDKIRRAAHRLDRIVRDVLSFARDTRVNAVATSAKEIFDLATCDCEAVLVTEHVAIRCEIDGDCSFSGDGALIGQAVSNLIRNAVEAMRGSSVREIVLGAREARLRVADGGRRAGAFREIACRNEFCGYRIGYRKYFSQRDSKKDNRENKGYNTGSFRRASLRYGPYTQSSKKKKYYYY